MAWCSGKYRWTERHALPQRSCLCIRVDPLSRLTPLTTLKAEDANLLMKQNLSETDKQTRENSERLAKRLNEFLAEQTAKEQAGAPEQD